MKSTTVLSARPSTGGADPAAHAPLPHLITPSTVPGESIRHILLGKPEAIQQTIHLLHILHYSETVLWSPVLTETDPIIVTPSQAEAMSLLRKAM